MIDPTSPAWRTLKAHMAQRAENLGEEIAQSGTPERRADEIRGAMAEIHSIIESVDRTRVTVAFDRPIDPATGYPI